MYCQKCGKEIPDTAQFCEACGQPTIAAPVIDAKAAVMNNESKHKCPKCKSHRIEFQTVSESKKTGCLTVLFYIFLACTVLGLFILIPLLLRKKTKTVTYGVCQNCGHKWKV